MEGKCVTGGRLDAGSALAMAAEFSNDANETRRQVANNDEKEKREGKIIYRIAN